MNFIVYFVHANDATRHGGFQEVLGCHCHSKNKEGMAKLIASELSGSDESGDEGAGNMSFEHCDPIWWWAVLSIQNYIVFFLVFLLFSPRFYNHSFLYYRIWKDTFYIWVWGRTHARFVTRGNHM